MPADKKIAIIGAGPTGLGAGHRLSELGHTNFQVYEQSGIAGGLATSERDDKGFLWDLGPHILFSHYRYVDELATRAVPKWISLKRESWIWIEERLVPYPLQNNIRHLSKESCWKALQGLIEVHRKNTSPANFKEWIHALFGQGLADIFMLPYNEKVWAWPLETMDFQWIGERVAVVDLESVLDRVIHEKDELDWGPNSRFRFPAEGGIGELWKGVASLMDPARIAFNREVTRIDVKAKKLHFKNGAPADFDMLISTLPLPLLIEQSGIASLQPYKQQFKHNSTHVIGLGIAGQPEKHLKNVSWIYFPESDYPFYRATIFSNYASYSVPDARSHWSILVEFSESAHRPLNPDALLKEATQGLRRAKILPEKTQIVSTSYRKETYGYPIPFLGRDKILDDVHQQLQAHDIYSRGRFGGWKYEVSNQDQSLMQGVELVNRLLLGIPETTYWFPGTVNQGKYATL